MLDRFDHHTAQKTPTHRIEKVEGIELLKKAPLSTLMRTGYRLRKERYPEPLVTFVCDTNPNYTNICVTRCRFCAFCRDRKDTDAYTLTPDELAMQVQAAADQGASTVLLQGGHNPEMTLKDWENYIRVCREVAPQIHVHPFSPPEIAHMAQKEKISIHEVLCFLKDQNIDTIPGGGAEILAERVRGLISAAKISSDQWLSIMEQAHLLGFRTTATMMFGHLEADEDIIEHLFRLRRLQDRTGGFTSFVPWSFKPGGSVLSDRITQSANPAKYVRIIAVARIVLDNFEHIQSSWFSENVTAGQLGLLAGADDFGGLLIQENVLKETGFAPKTTLEKVCEIIRNAGFIPARRNSYYQIVERYT